jgi:hypothetical protein
LKISTAIVLCCASALLAGCESGFGDSVHSVLAPREKPRTRIFQADPRAAYEAARTAAEEMGYRYVRGGPAEGRLEELSGISAGDEPGSSRQISMSVRLDEADGGGTSVSVAFGEILETDSASEPAFATQTPLRGTPQYEVFFRNLQNALQAGAKGQ